MGVVSPDSGLPESAPLAGGTELHPSISGIVPAGEQNEVSRKEREVESIGFSSLPHSESVTFENGPSKE